MEKIVQKRSWDNAEIKLIYDKDGVSIECNTEDFVKAFVNNVPNMSLDFKTETIKGKCKDALLKTLKELKTESVRIAR